MYGKYPFLRIWVSYIKARRLKFTLNIHLIEHMYGANHQLHHLYSSKSRSTYDFFLCIKYIALYMENNHYGDFGGLDFKLDS